MIINDLVYYNYTFKDKQNFSILQTNINQHQSYINDQLIIYREKPSHLNHHPRNQ